MSCLQALSSSPKLWVRATVHLTSPTQLPGGNRVTVLDTTLQHNPRKLLSITSLLDSLPHGTLEWTKLIPSRVPWLDMAVVLLSSPL